MKFHISDETPNIAAPSASLSSLKSWSSSTRLAEPGGVWTQKGCHVNQRPLAEAQPGARAARGAAGRGGEDALGWGGGLRKKREERVSKPFQKGFPIQVAKCGAPPSGHTPWLSRLIPWVNQNPTGSNCSITYYGVYTQPWDSLY